MKFKHLLSISSIYGRRLCTRSTGTSTQQPLRTYMCVGVMHRNYYYYIVRSICNPIAQNLKGLAQRKKCLPRLILCAGPAHPRLH
jgi:hypothetical protein